MSLEGALSNIKYFFGVVVPEAITSGLWDKDAIDRAFYWAEYCQKIHSESKHHSKAEIFDSAIAALQKDLLHASISLDYLGASTEILIRGFLQNKYIRKETLQLVLDKAKELNHNVDHLIEEHNEMCSLGDELLQLCGSVLASESIGLCVAHEVEAKYMLEDVIHAVSSHTSADETEKYLLVVANSMCSDQDKIETFLHILLLDSDELHFVQRFFLSYVCQRVSLDHKLFDPSLAANIWMQPVKLLRMVSSKHFLFYKCYVDMLLSWGNSIKLDSRSSESMWKVKASDSPQSFTFKKLVSHFLCLCNSSDKVAMATQTALHLCAESGKDGSVWNDIKSHLRDGMPENG